MPDHSEGQERVVSSLVAITPPTEKLEWWINSENGEKKMFDSGYEARGEKSNKTNKMLNNDLARVNKRVETGSV